MYIQSLYIKLYIYIIDCNNCSFLLQPLMTKLLLNVPCNMQKIIFVKRGYYIIQYSGPRRLVTRRPRRKRITLPKPKTLATLFKVVQLPRGSRETEMAVLIVFFCGEIIIKEMREHNVLLNFPLGPFSRRRRRPSCQKFK